MASQAIGTLGTIDTVTVGGRVFTDLTNLIQIIGVITGGGQRSCMRKLSASAGYAPSGVTFKPKAGIFWVTVTSMVSASGGCTFAYSDNDSGLASNSTALTNGVYICGTSAAEMCNTDLASGGKEEFIMGDWSVPSGKYINVQASTSTTGVGHLYGYEV